jgi:hypothetical protein
MYVSHGGEPAIASTGQFNNFCEPWNKNNNPVTIRSVAYAYLSYGAMNFAMLIPSVENPPSP